jgi:hypothetical protein
MCENCWTAEVNAFTDESDWSQCNAAVAGKLEGGTLRHNGITHEHSIYECAVCGEFWKLATPVAFPGGHLVRMKTATGSKAVPSTIVIIIVIGILALLFAKLFQYIFGN